MIGTYNQGLVAISLLVAILASYTALDMSARVASSQSRRAARIWLVGGAVAMGLGIWSMHFIGMLAFKLPIPVGYDLLLTVCSLAASIAASMYALWLVSRQRLAVSRLLAGAVLMGLGIAAMHYIGMAAMQMQPGIDYDPAWFTASILIAIGASAAALWIAQRLRHEQPRLMPMRLLASLVMGIAVVGMHYTGMAAARFPANAICGAIRGGGLDTHLLAGLVIVTTIATLAVALLASVFDGQMRLRTGLLAHSLANANEKLVQAALHDPLTQLPNRVLLQDRIERAIEKANRREFGLALMFCDLDGFKNVNDAYGHQLGDRLLVQFSRKISALLRSQDTFARLGGDEFVIVMAIDTPDDAALMAEQISTAISTPFLIDNAELLVSTSIGIALYPEDASNERELMMHADAAMYHVKHSGRNGHAFFTSTMQAGTRQRLRLLQDLRHATARNELVLHYQPKFPAGGSRANGAEALLRWNHPELGMLSPDVFIPVAERSGLIIPIGEWVLDAACAQLRSWHDAGNTDWSMAVNLSPLQFASPTLVETVRCALERHALDPRQLTLEVTESTAMKDVEASLQMLEALTAMGVRIAIDDFGTGYSSLLYLKRMPATELKIDRAFVRDLEHNSEDAAIVSSIIALGRTLQLQVVAEGVETEAQRNFLGKLGCDVLQGYHLGRPMAATEFMRCNS